MGRGADRGPRLRDDRVRHLPHGRPGRTPQPPDSKAQYVTADLLSPPAEWHRAYDLVVEIYTVQALPIDLQPAAIKQVGEQVAPGGTLLVIAASRADDVPDSEVEGPPWPLTRSAIQSFATPDLRLIQLDQSPSPVDPTILRWRAEYLRD